MTPKRDFSGPSVNLATGCGVASFLALLPILYVGSYAVLIADHWYGLNCAKLIDDRWPNLLPTIYGPLSPLVDLLLDT